MSNPLNHKEDWMGDPFEALTGFSWKAGLERDTTGIAIWSDIFLHEKPTGEKIAIVLMDTQGMFERKTADEDSTIFAISTWLSSVQIVNVKNKIEEDQLQRLRVGRKNSREI